MYTVKWGTWGLLCTRGPFFRGSLPIIVRVYCTQRNKSIGTVRTFSVGRVEIKNGGNNFPGIGSPKFCLQLSYMTKFDLLDTTIGGIMFFIYTGHQAQAQAQGSWIILIRRVSLNVCALLSLFRQEYRFSPDLGLMIFSGGRCPCYVEEILLHTCKCSMIDPAPEKNCITNPNRNAVACGGRPNHPYVLYCHIIMQYT